MIMKILRGQHRQPLFSTVSPFRLDGNLISKQLLLKLRDQLNYSLIKFRKAPRLDILSVGSNAASLSYIGKKTKTAKEIGIDIGIHQFGQGLLGDFNYPLNVKLIERTISELNNNPDCSGILLQLPLPMELLSHSDRLIELISPIKDVDCLTSFNRQQLVDDNSPRLVPCTPKAILHLIQQAKCEIKGKNAVVIGRSKLVGSPTVQMLLKSNATVTVCHKATQNLQDHVLRADIVVSAAGVPNLIQRVKPNSTVIDVGISRVNNKIVGDVLQAAKQVCFAYTPVPGGVGPMTVAALMQNIVKLWQFQKKSSKEA